MAGFRIVDGKGQRAKEWIDAIIIGRYKRRKDMRAAQEARMRTFGFGAGTVFNVDFAKGEVEIVQ